MTATQQFIEDAIEGGWKSTFVENEKLKHQILYGNEYPVYAMLLDPKAWQAVGKVRGWDKSTITLSWHTKHYWENNLHIFIDHLAENKTIEQALQLITKEK